MIPSCYSTLRSCGDHDYDCRGVGAGTDFKAVVEITGSDSRVADIGPGVATSGHDQFRLTEDDLGSGGGYFFLRIKLKLQMAPGRQRG